MRALFAAVLLLSLPAQAQLIDRVIAVVDEDIITYRELEQRGRIIVNQLRQNNVALPDEDELIGQVLDSMVLGRLQMRYAEHLGIEMADAQLDAQIAQLAQFNQLSVEEFRRRMNASGVRYEEFRSYMREKALVEQLHNVVSRNRVRVSESDIDQFLRLDSERLEDDVRYRIRHILVSLLSSATSAEQSDARRRIEAAQEKVRSGDPFASVAVLSSDGQKALDGGDLGWRAAAELPDIAATEITLLEVGEMTNIIRSPSGFHLFYLEAREGGGQVLIEQTRARHILIRPDELNTIEEVHDQLLLLRTRALDGEEFAELARVYSQDTASSVDGGDLGWKAAGELDPTFENKMSQLREGGISEPFETRFGLHLVEVVERREVDETQQDLRRRATNYIAKSRVGDAIQEWLLQLRENAYIRYLVAADDGSP